MRARQSDLTSYCARAIWRLMTLVTGGYYEIVSDVGGRTIHAEAGEQLR